MPRNRLMKGRDEQKRKRRRNVRYIFTDGELADGKKAQNETDHDSCTEEEFAEHGECSLRGDGLSSDPSTSIAPEWAGVRDARIRSSSQSSWLWSVPLPQLRLGIVRPALVAFLNGIEPIQILFDLVKRHAQLHRRLNRRNAVSRSLGVLEDQLGNLVRHELDTTRYSYWQAEPIEVHDRGAPWTPPVGLQLVGDGLV